MLRLSNAPRHRRIAIAHTLLVVAILSAPLPGRADPVGVATLVERMAQRAPPAADWVILLPAGGVYADDRVRSAPDGGLRVTFLDQSELTVGPGATVTVDRFVYDPDDRSGSLVAELGTGLFRFTTGAIRPESVALRTPTATLGVRGTVFDIVVDAAGRTAVRVESGTVLLQALAGALVELGPDEAAFIDSIGDVDIEVIEAEAMRELEQVFDLNLRALDQASQGLRSDVFTAWEQLVALEDDVALETALARLTDDLEGEVETLIGDGEAVLDGIARDLLDIGGQLSLP